MAEAPRMTTAREAVEQLMQSEHADVLKASVAFMVGELIEAELAAHLGAEFGERAPDRWLAQRNGYRHRAWQTRVGELDLAIPKLRRGSFMPTFLEPRRRAEQALVAVIQEAYVNGVSTRKVDRVVEQLGVHGVSKDQVSRLAPGLDEQVEAFRQRPLGDARYPYVWLDAKVERVREPGGVRHKCLVLAYGVHDSGRREVLGLDVGEAETEAFWRQFLRELVARGLTGVRIVVSDAHPGLKAAIAQVLERPGSDAPFTSSATCVATSRPPTSRWSPARSAASSPLPRAPKPASASATSSRSSPGPPRRSPACSKKPSPTCSRSSRSRPSTGASCGRPTRLSASTRRSAGAPTSSASSPNNAALIRLAGAFVIEQNDEWLVGRRYLSEASMKLALSAGTETENLSTSITKEELQLAAAKAADHHRRPERATPRTAT